MSIPERILLHVDHPRFSNISAEVYEIDTKRGPMRNFRVKRSFLNNGTLGASSSVALSEVDAVIELGKAVKAHFLPESVKHTEPIPSTSKRPEHVVYTANKKTPPDESTQAADETQYNDQQYGSDQQLSSSSTQFEVNDEDLPF